MKALLTFALLSVAVFGFGQADGKPCSAELTVTVINAATGNPFAGAKVILTNEKTNASEAKKANEQGVVTFSIGCDTDYTVMSDEKDMQGNPERVRSEGGKPVAVTMELHEIINVGSSAGYHDQFVVKVYNPGSADINIRLGASEKTMKTIPVPANEVWESDALNPSQPQLLWITTGKTVKKYVTGPGKAYQIDYNKAIKCYVLKEVNVEK